MTISLEVCMNMCELWIANSHVPQTSNIYPKKHLAIFQIIYNNESPNQKKWIATKTLHGLCSLRHIVEIFHILHNCGPIAQEIFSMLCVSIVCTRSRNLPCASGFVWIRVCGCVCVWAMHGITTKCAIFLRKKPSYKWLLCEWNISTLAINNTPFTHFPTWKNISSCSIFIKASTKKKTKASPSNDCKYNNSSSGPICFISGAFGITEIEQKIACGWKFQFRNNPFFLERFSYSTNHHEFDAHGKPLK